MVNWMLRISPQFFKMRQIAKRYIWEETMEHSKQYVNCLGIQAPLIFKVPVITLHFYKRLMLAPVSLTKRKLKWIFAFREKGKK